VDKISIWEDPPRFPGLARESGKWERSYHKPGAVERSKLEQAWRIVRLAA
jgi:hypothetical protein